MNQGTSNVDSTLSPAAGRQPAWDEERAAWWLANADAREKQLQPVSDALFEAASLQPGERVLDVGVGSGPTTGQAWEAVRPYGSVTGIDIAPPMIAAARQRITASEIEWIVGDAASYDFSPRTYDAVISRFGVMFFTDPVAAFRNLCEATRPGGRLIVTVWSQLYATGLFGIPYTVATATLHRLGAEYQGFPPDGILFSLGRPETVRDVLNAAGWADIETTVDNRTLYLPPDPPAAGKDDHGVWTGAGVARRPAQHGSGRGGVCLDGGLRASPERVGNRAPGGLHRGGSTTSLSSGTHRPPSRTAVAPVGDRRHPTAVRAGSRPLCGSWTPPHGPRPGRQPPAGNVA